MPPSPPSLLRAESLLHHLTASPEVTLDLRGTTLMFEARTLTLIAGAPGSGAGLLLRILGLLERPAAGEVFFEAEPASELDDQRRLEMRSREFGFVFDEPFLLDSLSVAENVAMPIFKISCLNLEKARQRTAALLDFVNLADAADRAVSELGPLAQHKLAVARALANGPRVLIVEDAGAHLAEEDRAEFMACLRGARDTYGLTVIAHSSIRLEAMTGADQEVRLSKGRLAEPASKEEARAHE